MIEIKNEGIILEKTNLEFENQAVLNPGVIEKDGVTHMFYRAVREGNFSTIGYCQLKDNKVIYRMDKPFLAPEFDYESHGLEDPRIIHHEDGLYYLFYTVYDGKNARVAYATSTDLKKFEKKGLITPSISYDSAMNYFHDLPQKEKFLKYGLKTKRIGGEGTLLWDKDAFIFPKFIDGKYAFLHRIKPSIQLMHFSSFSELTEDFWKGYLDNMEQFMVLEPRKDDEYIGGGCPPIETDEGWLFIYHRVIKINGEENYCAGAALLDKKDPRKVIKKLKDPLFVPKEEWEKNGDVNNVVFPTGAVLKDGQITVYYGAADKVIGAKTFSLNNVLSELKTDGIGLD